MTSLASDRAEETTVKIECQDGEDRAVFTLFLTWSRADEEDFDRLRLDERRPWKRDSRPFPCSVRIEEGDFFALDESMKDRMPDFIAPPSLKSLELASEEAIETVTLPWGRKTLVRGEGLTPTSSMLELSMVTSCIDSLERRDILSEEEEGMLLLKRQEAEVLESIHAREDFRRQQWACERALGRMRSHRR